MLNDSREGSEKLAHSHGRLWNSALLTEGEKYFERRYGPRYRPKNFTPLRRIWVLSVSLFQGIELCDELRTEITL
jgi:hypothetical protein